jgi:4-hydroxybenzoyl-CoA thioesterase
MTKLVSRRQFPIEWAHCDPAGIVFNSRFYEFFDWGTWTLFAAALGVRPAELAAAGGNESVPLAEIGAPFLIPLVEVDAEFLAAVRFGDVVEMTSQVREFRRSSFEVEHRLSAGGELAVIGHEKRVFVIRDRTDPSIIKSLPIPNEVIKRFEVESTHE